MWSLWWLWAKTDYWGYFLMNVQDPKHSYFLFFCFHGAPQVPWTSWHSLTCPDQKNPSPVDSHFSFLAMCFYLLTLFPGHLADRALGDQRTLQEKQPGVVQNPHARPSLGSSRVLLLIYWVEMKCIFWLFPSISGLVPFVQFYSPRSPVCALAQL